MTIAPLDRPFIEPPFKAPSTHECAVETKPPGCLLVIAWVIVCWVGYSIGSDIKAPEFERDEWLLKWLFYFAPCIAAFMVVSGIQSWFETRNANQSAERHRAAVAKAHASHQALVEELRRSNEKQSHQEAQQLTERLRKDTNIAVELRQHYWNLLGESRRQVKQALWEFDQTAFGVYWDRIEDALDHFNRARDVVMD